MYKRQSVDKQWKTAISAICEAAPVLSRQKTGALMVIERKSRLGEDVYKRQVLEVKNVSKQYKGEDKLLFDAVSDVSLSMADHRIYALVGESGCGKSTLSRLILGLESPSSGQILLDRCV